MNEFVEVEFLGAGRGVVAREMVSVRPLSHAQPVVRDEEWTNRAISARARNLARHYYTEVRAYEGERVWGTASLPKRGRNGVRSYWRGRE